MECDDKAALRERIRRRRRSLTAVDLQAAAEALGRHLLAAPALRRAALVAAYVPVGSEPGSVAFLDGLRHRGVRVLLPVVCPDRELDWALYTGALRAGPLGLREPAGSLLGADSVTGCDLVLAPAMAADRSGNRLGRGAGYYDRALARVDRAVPVAALLHDGELLESLPAEPHDRLVTAAVTPRSGWVDLG